MLTVINQFLKENGIGQRLNGHMSELTPLINVQKKSINQQTEPSDITIDIPPYTNAKDIDDHKYNNPALEELDFELLDIVRLATSATNNIVQYPLTTPQDLILENEELMKAQYETCRSESTVEESPSIAEELRGLATLVYPIVLTYIL
jgi:hypothetical protein